MTSKFFGSWLIELAVLMAPCSVVAQDVQRPKCYAESWRQFFIQQDRDCTRQVGMIRLGAGAVRPAEYSLWEWVDNQRRLKMLWKTKLRNPYFPWSHITVDGGRFLVTFDDAFMLNEKEDIVHQWSPGTTQNCIVMYDMARNVSAAFRLEDFLPDVWRKKPLFSPGSWRCSSPYVNPVARVVYIGTPKMHRMSWGDDAPYLALDLLSLSVGVMDRAPTKFSDVVYSDADQSWEWSLPMGKDSPPDPDWGGEHAFPIALKGKRVRDLGPDWPFQPVEDVVYFRFDKASGDYLRCQAKDVGEDPDSKEEKLEPVPPGKK